MNRGNFAGDQGQQTMGNQAGANQNGNQNMPSVDQLAQMMLANFDADGSGELNQAELQSGLTALRQMMLRRMRGGNGMGQQENGVGQQAGGAANQRNAMAGRQNQRFDQAQGNRPIPTPTPPRGQGNRGRGDSLANADGCNGRR